MRNSIHTFKLGNYDCFIINDDSVISPFDEMIKGEASQEQLAQVALDFELDLNNMVFDTNNLLVSTGDKNILIDTGSGKHPYHGNDEGKLLQSLDSLRYNPSDIDAIVITHSDHDHIGGILDENGQLVFPNAQYYLSSNSWNHWSSDNGRANIAALHGWPEDRIKYVWEIYSAIQDKLSIVDYEEEFLPGFRMYPAIGHRLDHDVLKIKSLDKKLIHIVDGLILPLVMANPYWYFTFDIQPEKALEAKEQLLKWCKTEEALIFGTHFQYPGLGTIKKDDDAWHWHPVID